MFSSEFRNEVRREVEQFQQVQADSAQAFVVAGQPRPSLVIGSNVGARNLGETGEEYPSAAGLAMPDEHTLLEQYREHTGPIDLDGEMYYLVEGDLLLDEDELDLYVRQQAALLRRQQATAEAQVLGYGRLVTADPAALVGMAVGGRLVRWRPGATLSYAIRKETFLTDDQYDQVRSGMERATGDWEDVCGVRFEHLSDFDDGGRPDGADPFFTVRLIDAQGEFIASAFFPTDPPSRRRVLIDHTYFDDGPGGFDRVGVLRHELGHVLGFRHEHIRSGAPPNCRRESLVYAGTIATELTPYDPKSVMHYLCGGAGSRELRITELDVAGAQRIYGPPLNAVQFV